MSVVHIELTDDKAALAALRAGDTVELSGAVYTARDAAHRRFKEAADSGKPFAVDLSGKLVYYAGPCPTKPGRIIGSVAATTSLRMDPYVELLFQQGVLGTIGKGSRDPYVAELCKKYGGVYFLGIGGAAALGSRYITSCEVLAFDDLGPESVKRLVLEKMPFIVGIDSRGSVFQTAQIAAYRRP